MLTWSVAMGAGRADLECDSTTNTTERRERVAFTVPHHITGARLLVRADSPIAELRDLDARDSCPPPAPRR
jgi:ABC-type amino acid transport substrate-binding protein